MGGAVFLPCSLPWDQMLVGVMAVIATSFKRAMPGLLHSMPMTQQKATLDPRLHWRCLDTHRQVWLSLLWCHFSFLLGPGVHKVLFVPSNSLFPLSCENSVIHPTGLPNHTLGLLSPFARSSGREICCEPRPFTTDFPTTQEMTLHMDITRLSILKPDWLYYL